MHSLSHKNNLVLKNYKTTTFIIFSDISILNARVYLMNKIIMKLYFVPKHIKDIKKLCNTCYHLVM